LLIPVPVEAALNLELTPVASGLCSPVGLTHAGDGSGRLFIADQCGTIRLVDGSGLLPTPFLDLTAVVPALNSNFDERGLLGVAFHPDYATNGRFFVRYSVARVGVATEPCFGAARGCHKEVLAEFAVSTNDANLADTSPPRVLFEIDEPEFNHNAGGVAFGPDGFLYFSLGDGGGANDGLDLAGLPHGPTGNGQNKDTALGALLRIDVDGTPDPGLEYRIPDNPFVGTAGVDEIYAFGLRNPFAFSFDDGPGGDGALYVADVGQDLFEELDVVVKGGNYGWVIREGFHCFDPLNPTTPPVSCATTGATGEPLLDPVLEYDHGVGLSMIGGFVYRGSAMPGLQGHYVFGDFSMTFAPDGQLFFTPVTGPGAFERQDILVGPSGDPFAHFVKGFGEDEEGELYVLASTALGPTGNTGVAFKFASFEAVPSLPAWAAALAAFLLVTVVASAHRRLY
jgi:glucose/arabinose dehydrogenase